MKPAEYFPIGENHFFFSHIAFNGDLCELKVGDDHVSFHLSVAEEVASHIQSYVQDRNMRRKALLEEYYPNARETVTD